jgi:DNA-directed RNA polymerase omega subunit
MPELPPNVDSKFRLVLLAATRAEQMMRGAQPKLDRPNAKPTRVAMEEFQRDLVDWGPGPLPEAPIEEGMEEADLAAE